MWVDMEDTFVTRVRGGGGCKLIPIDVTDVTRQPIKRSDEKYLCKQTKKQKGSKPKEQQPRNVPSVSGGGSILTHNGGKDEHAGEKVGNHK